MCLYMKRCESQKFHKVVEPHIATKPRVVEATDWKIFAYEACEHPKALGVHGDTCRCRSKNTVQVFSLLGDVGMLYLGDVILLTVLILNLLFLPQFLKHY